jgi:hypothetical protein
MAWGRRPPARRPCPLHTRALPSAREGSADACPSRPPRSRRGTRPCFLSGPRRSTRSAARGAPPDRILLLVVHHHAVRPRLRTLVSRHQQLLGSVARLNSTSLSPLLERVAKRKRALAQRPYLGTARIPRRRACSLPPAAPKNWMRHTMWPTGRRPVHHALCAVAHPSLLPGRRACLERDPGTRAVRIYKILTAQNALVPTPKGITIAFGDSKCFEVDIK